MSVKATFRAAMVAALLLAGPALGQAKGDKFEVQWGGKWYAATVLETDGSRTKIHYDGWSSSWDEWVTKDRLRPVTVKTTGRATGEAVADATPAPSKPAPGKPAAKPAASSPASTSKHKAHCDPFWAEARKDCFLRDRESFSCPIVAANKYEQCLKTGRWY